MLRILFSLEVDGKTILLIKSDILCTLNHDFRTLMVLATSSCGHFNETA